MDRIGGNRDPSRGPGRGEPNPGENKLHSGISPQSFVRRLLQRLFQRRALAGAALCAVADQHAPEGAALLVCLRRGEPAVQYGRFREFEL